MVPPTIPPDGSHTDGAPGDWRLAQAQRERIMDAMAATVGDLGYPNTTIRAIVARANVSSTTYYSLFEDKEACFLATVDQRVERLIAAVTEACRREPSPRERFRRGLEAFLELCVREPDTARLCVVELQAAGHAARARRAEAIERLAELTEAALARPGSHTLSENVPRLSPIMLVGGIHHLVHERIAKGDLERLPELAPDIVRLVVPADGGE